MQWTMNKCWILPVTLVRVIVHLHSSIPTANYHLVEAGVPDTSYYALQGNRHHQCITQTESGTKNVPWAVLGSGFLLQIATTGPLTSYKLQTANFCNAQVPQKDQLKPALWIFLPWTRIGFIFTYSVAKGCGYGSNHRHWLTEEQ